MSNALGNQFDNQNTGGKNKNGGGLYGHPYALRSVQRCTSVDEVEAIMNSNNNPSCVVATGLSLDHGPARDMLLQWADNDNHSILFTDSSQCHVRPWVQKLRAQHQQQQSASGVLNDAMTGTSLKSQGTEGTIPVTKASASSETNAAGASTGEGTGDVDDHGDVAIGEAIANSQDISEYTTSYQLLYHWCKAQWEDREMDDSVTVDVLVPHRSTLKGPESKKFLEQEEAARVAKRKMEQERAMLREVELAKGRLRLGEADAASGGAPMPPTPSSKTKSNDTKASSVIGKTRPKKKSRFDQSLFLKFSKPLHCKFCSSFWSL